MKELRDLAIVFLLLVMTGFLGHIAYALIGNRIYLAMGSLALLVAFAVFLGFIAIQVKYAGREFREAREEKRETIARDVRERRNDVPVARRQALDPVKRLP